MFCKSWSCCWSPPWQPRPLSVLTRPWDSSSQTTAARCLRGAWMHCCACMSTRTYNWILKKWWRHTGINIQKECCWVDRWMHDFLHAEHLLLGLPDLPSDFNFFVNIVNICTNYLANWLSEFSEIIPQNSDHEKCISAHRNFQNFPGSMPPRPPRGGEGKPSPWSLRDQKFWGLKIPRPPPPPRDSNPGSATDCNTFSIFCWYCTRILGIPTLPMSSSAHFLLLLHLTWRPWTMP